MGKSSSSCSSDDRRRRRKKKKASKTEQLEKSVNFLTDAVLKISSALKVNINEPPVCRSRSTNKRASRSRSRSRSIISVRSGYSSTTPKINRRSRSPFSVPRGDDDDARDAWLDTLSKEKEKDKEQSSDVLVISATDDQLIQLLGSDPGSTQKKGEIFHDGIATRWQEIAKSGLTKEERDKIKSVLKPPPNCEFGPPVLNSELAKAVIPIVRSRDDELGRVQSNLQVSISGLGNVLTSLLNEKEPLDRAKLVAAISNAGRFLVGTQYSVSLLRRRIIKDNMKDVAIKELLHETPMYPQLFEADLGQKIKQMQALTKVGNDIAKPNANTRTESSTSMKKPDQPRSSISRPTLNSYRPLPTSRYTTSRRRSGRYNRK